MRVSYDKAMRDKAAERGMGLITISVTRPGQDRAFGGRITVQHHATLAECKRVERSLISHLKRTKGE